MIHTWDQSHQQNWKQSRAVFVSPCENQNKKETDIMGETAKQSSRETKEAMGSLWLYAT